ncbi:PREDICTED: coagulation factor IX-like, partial [Wasmannia auropunctata]|uniref:coagulation factor IX-like n=1 Tax=Wasmannia auropunctata TaxID=64793 RepID=UPI0005EF5839
MDYQCIVIIDIGCTRPNEYKSSQSIGLTLNSEMVSKAIVFFALLAVAVAERPRTGLRMPPILPPFARPLSPQVVGGEEAPKGGYPYIVSLQILSQHFCAGSILNENWIVTAGHCVQAVPSINLLRVKAGKHDIRRNEDTEQTVQVVEGIIHENY